ncbi:hypothetical protein [Streptomyces virginiae]
MSVSLAKTPATIEVGRSRAARNRALRSNDLNALAAELNRGAVLLTEGRYWLMDVVSPKAKGWRPEQVRRAVQLYYAGGWAAFSVEAFECTTVAR